MNNKPLLAIVVEKLKGIVNEVVIVAASEEKVNEYAQVLPHGLHFALDEESEGSLEAALTGFRASHGKYSLLLPSNAPFVSNEVVSLLFELCVGKSAVIPRWPDNRIEVLQSVYETRNLLESGKEKLANNAQTLEDLVNKMRGVRYLSTMVIKQLDPDFLTFFKVESSLQLKKAAAIEKSRKQGSQKASYK